MEQKPRNDRQNGVTKFCLALEEFRRTDAGRVKNATELVAHFFPHDATNARDLLFVYMPREVRAHVIAGWGIRGQKAARSDDDDRIKSVVHDAILAGDIDERAFEEGVTPALIADWVPLHEWWAFWRSGKVSGIPAQKALATARELGLFDDRWFLENIDSRGGRLKGTDTLCDTLVKEQMVAWVRSIHASGDGTPAGIIKAIGWDTVLTKTSHEGLLFAVDALAKKIGLVESRPAVGGSERPGIAIPDFVIERTSATSKDVHIRLPDVVPIPKETRQPATAHSHSRWPEIAGPGDMGYALLNPRSVNARAFKPVHDTDDDEVTSEHRMLAQPEVRRPPTSPERSK